jgi:single-strand DNA-binding protein
MSTKNRVQLTGNLGGDPEIKKFDNGNKVARFSMATNEEYHDKNGEKNTETQWHQIVAWGKLADKVEEDCKKGSFITIEGRLTTRSYTDSNSQKKYITEVVASDVVVNLPASV